MKTDRKIKEVLVQIPEELYNSLIELAKKSGYADINEYIVYVLETHLGEKPFPEEALDRVKIKLERYIQDELNKRLAVIENLKKQLTDLYEKIETLASRIDRLEQSSKDQASTPTSREQARKSGIERLREEKVVFESRLPSRIQRDRLFSYFERMGAVVLKLSKERIAIDPDYWKEFKNKLLNELSTNRDEDVLSVLGQVGYELWKTLYSDNAIIFDPRTKKWRFITTEVP